MQYTMGYLYIVYASMERLRKNTIYDFLSQRFSDIFLLYAYQSKDICIALISDAYVKLPIICMQSFTYIIRKEEISTP